MRFALRNAARNLRVGVLIALAAGVSALFLLYFCSSIQTYQTQLDESYAALTVNAHIAHEYPGRTPRISPIRLERILKSGFVKSCRLVATVDMSDEGILLRAPETLDMDPVLERSWESIQWAEGIVPEDFLAGDDLICIAPAGWEDRLGEVVTFAINFQPVELTVAGVYGKPQSEYSTATQVYYCSLPTMRRMYEQVDEIIIYNAVEMELQDLPHLDDFKAEMKKAGFDKGSAVLVIDDAQLQRVTAQLRRQIRLLRSLQPVFFVLVAAIGFGLSFLVLRSRRREAAVMRSLGARRSLVFGILFEENALFSLVGTILGGGAGLLLLGNEALRPGELCILLLCFLAGGAAAVLRLSGLNAFTVMTANE